MVGRTEIGDHQGCASEHRFEDEVDRRVDREGASDRQHSISLLGHLLCGGDGRAGQQLTEHHGGRFEDASAHGTVRVLVAGLDPIENLPDRPSVCTRDATDPLQIPMEFRDGGVRQAGFLVETVDILSDTPCGATTLPKVDNGSVGRIRTDVADIEVSGEMDPPHLSSCIRVSQVAADLEQRRVHSRPKTVWAAKVRDPRLDRDAGTGEHEDVLRLAENVGCSLC